MPGSSSVYRMYIDETGSTGISKTTKGRNRYLCLLGCIIERRHYITEFFPRLSDIKADFFGERRDAPVVLHRRDIDERDGVFSILESEYIRRHFNLAMAEFYRARQYSLIAVAIDKVAHRERYRAKAWHPYHYCAKLMFERYCLFLENCNGTGDAVAESRNPWENKLLEAEWAKQYGNGTHYVRRSLVQGRLLSGQLHFRTKGDNVAGLQLADMLLQPAFEQMLVEKNLRRMIKNYCDVHICNAITDKWDRHPKSGDVWGCGKVLIL